MDKVTEPDSWLFEREARESGFDLIVGVDEAGRGPLAGPVVAAAVILPTDFDVTGVKDSKKLTEANREKAYERIISDAAAVGVGIIGPDVIDKINILQATYEAMRAALKDLGTAFHYVLVDGDKSIPDLDVPQRKIVKGDDKSNSIAAASIVAKVTRDRIMKELSLEYPVYGFEKHKGYGTREHLKAIEEHGVCCLHRRSFAPVAQRVQTGCQQQSLF